MFMCLYPKLVKNPKYIPNKKNKGIIPPVEDPRVLLVPIGCGKCMECKKKRSREWKVRLAEELREKKKALFVTLTFSDESLENLESKLKTEGCTLEGYDLDNAMAVEAIQQFTNRFKNRYKRRPRRWIVSEIGGKYSERIHLHGILFEEMTQEELTQIWKYGNVWIGDYVNEKTINYIVKYMTKTDPKHKYYNPIVRCSPGMGKGYTKRADARNNSYKEKTDIVQTNELYRFRTGVKVALPIYYRNKIYSERERELLWLEKLDQEVRYVDGIKIDISNGDEGYFSILATAREKNRRLGYGDDSIDWDRRRYERNRRKLKKLERIKRLKRKEVAMT